MGLWGGGVSLSNSLIPELLVCSLTFRMLSWEERICSVGSETETWFGLLHWLPRTAQCVVTTVTNRSSFVELFALKALTALRLLPKVRVSHSVLITKIPQVKGPIKYTWVFLLPKDSQIPLPSHLLKDKSISVSKEINFVLK